jgi:prepilin-type N-terminal cleavage/methylation domain-containing protein
VVKEHRGVTVIECIIALAVLGIAATGIVVHDHSALRTSSESFKALAATRFVAGQLDSRSRATLASGSRDWAVEDPALPGCVATETVTERERGLFEVEVLIRDAKGRLLARLATLMQRGEQG